MSKESIEKMKKTKRENPRPAWNKGLTKETDERVAKIAEKVTGSKRDDEPWNKGLTTETSIKLKEMGKKVSASQKNNPLVTRWPKGRKHSKETIEKIKKTKRENPQVAWNKGLTKETDERVRKYGESQRGKKYSDETCKKISESILNLPEEDRIERARNAGIISMSNLTLEQRTEKGINGYLKTPRKNTSIEKIIRKMLVENSIKFVEQQRIPKVGVPDFIIDPNICIFADGNYWHDRPSAIIKDKKQNKKLEKLGYVVLRFWGSELKKTPEDCLTRILKVL